MREVVTEKIFSGEEDLIQISTEDRLWDLVEKMKRLEKYIPCVINDVAVIGIDKEQELFLQEQCSNIAVNLHGSPLKVGSIDPYKPENAICIQKDGMFLAYPGEYGYEIRPLISVGYISILKRLEMDCGAMMRFDIKGGDRLPLPVREKGQILTRIAQLNSKLCYVITLDGCVPGVVSDQYVPLPYIDLLKAMKKVVTKEHPDLEFHSGTLSFEYLIANYCISYRIAYPGCDEEHGTFAGYFSAKNGEIIPLDGDIYELNEEVIESEEWTMPEEEIQNGLTIVVIGGLIRK